ncbi:MAG: hypothetical protein ACREBC_16715, partial [Pyrinomonadaceae bacterium]
PVRPLTKPFDETAPSVRVDRLPPELTLRLGVRATTNFGHHPRAAIADRELAKPDWHLIGRFSAHSVRKRR